MKVLVEEISLIIVRISQGGVKGDSWGIALLPDRLLMYLYILELFDEAKVWTRLDS